MDTVHAGFAAIVRLACLRRTFVRSVAIWI